MSGRCIIDELYSNKGKAILCTIYSTIASMFHFFTNKYANSTILSSRLICFDRFRSVVNMILKLSSYLGGDQREVEAKERSGVPEEYKWRRTTS